MDEEAILLRQERGGCRRGKREFARSRVLWLTSEGVGHPAVDCHRAAFVHGRSGAVTQAMARTKDAEGTEAGKLPAHAVG